MKRITREKGFRVMVMLVAFFLVTAILSSGNGYIGNFLTSFLLTPIQKAVSGGVYQAGDALTPEKSREELERELGMLKEENRRLNDMLVDYYDIKSRNEELNRFFDIKKENSDISLVPASVMLRDPNEDFYGFTADKGSAQGVSVNAPVVTENGLIGWVCAVAPRSCMVSTILSPEAGIGVEVKRTGDKGILSGSAEVSDDGITRMINLSEKNAIEKGDIVVTSGYGGVFPENLKVGKISRVTRDSFSGLPMAEIEPFEDVRAVSSAAIVVNFSGKNEIRGFTHSGEEDSDNEAGNNKSRG